MNSCWINSVRYILLGFTLVMGPWNLFAAPAEPLNAEGRILEVKYASQLVALRDELTKSLPQIDPKKSSAVAVAKAKGQMAETDVADVAQQLDKIATGQALIAHAKGKWIGGAEKGIAQAELALKKAKTNDDRAAATAELAKWQANKTEGLQALKERQAAYAAALEDEPIMRKAAEKAQAALGIARAAEVEAVNALLVYITPFLSSDVLDGKLVQAAMITSATPRGLAEFAQQSSEHAELIEKLFADHKLMTAMLSGGGAKYGHYGRAMQIYMAIQKASNHASSGHLQRLALATSLEHAQPIPELKSQDLSKLPSMIDPVKRYLHYEKAFLAGELDPAFKNFTTWEYRMVINSDAPDEILAWGREMLRNYRPDHMDTADYRWRYVATVRTEVPYGSQNVIDDMPSLQSYQNIIKNGGVCGRRAFFGRFILRCFCIPTWGVTQHKHAALSHWTPKGWVINLGADFSHSWWDKEETPMSGTQFLQESQARKNPLEYSKVLRAQWLSLIFGEQAYNERKKITGGFWSSVAQDLTMIAARKAEILDPVGQEFAETNEREQKINSTAVSLMDRKIIVDSDGRMVIPAVAGIKTSGKFAAMKSFGVGRQAHLLAGAKSQYVVDVATPGKYALSIKVATVQNGQKFRISVNHDEAKEIAVPYTVGMWQQTTPVEVALLRGENTFGLESIAGSRGVTIKEITLTPVK